MTMATVYAAGITTSTSMVTTTALRPCLSKTTSFSGSWSPLPFLAPRLASSINLSNDSKRLSLVKIRASSSKDTSGSPEVGEVVSDLKDKWDAVEDKSTLLLFGGGAIVAGWLSAFVAGAIDSVPLLPTTLELVGLGYTGWFVYRYLLSKASREELVTEIEALKNKITGTE